MEAHQRGEWLGEVGAGIAALIRDLHSSLDTDTDTDSGPTGLRELAVRFRAHATQDVAKLASAAEYPVRPLTV